MTPNGRTEAGDNPASPPRTRFALELVEFDEPDTDEIDAQALIRRIQSEGAIAPDTWSFHFD